MGCPCGKVQKDTKSVQKIKNRGQGVIIGSSNEGGEGNILHAAEKRQQKNQLRGIQQQSYNEIQFLKKKQEEAEKYERDKGGNYKLQYGFT